MRIQGNRNLFLKLFYAFLLIVFLQPIQSGELNLVKVIAYPNPFSPETDKLTIQPDGSAAFSGDVQYYIYDFNEKEVFSGQTSNSAIYWSGFLADGSQALPGLYFVKVIVTNSNYSTGVYIVKVMVK